MKIQKILQPKSFFQIKKDLENISRGEKIKAIINYLISNEDGVVYDFLGFVTNEVENNDLDIWRIMAEKVIDNDKDQGTGRWVSLSAEDRKQLKKDPAEWFDEEWSDEEIVEEFLLAIPDENFHRIMLKIVLSVELGHR
jgi:hypothetical protein